MLKRKRKILVTLAAVFGVNFLGFFIAILTGAAFQAFALYVLNAKFPGIVNAVPLLLFGVFSMVTMWRCSPDPKESVKGALTRMWVIIFSLYILSLSYKFTTEW